jgi:hypothetical protein
MTTATEAAPIAAPATQPPATWFTRQQNLQGVDDVTRDVLMAECTNFTAFGVRGGVVILRTERATVLCEPREVQGQPLVFFDYSQRGGKCRLVWWLPTGNIICLSARMKANPELRAPFLMLLDEANG